MFGHVTWPVQLNNGFAFMRCDYHGIDVLGNLPWVALGPWDLAASDQAVEFEPSMTLALADMVVGDYWNDSGVANFPSAEWYSYTFDGEFQGVEPVTMMDGHPISDTCLKIRYVWWTNFSPPETEIMTRYYAPGIGVVMEEHGNTGTWKLIHSSLVSSPIPDNGTGLGSGYYGEYVDGTDRWFVDFDGSALQASLTTLGWYSAGNAEVVKLTVTQRLEAYYSGLDISFCTAPLDGGVKPGEPGMHRCICLGPRSYNRMRIWDANDPGSAMGAVFEDDGANSCVENFGGTIVLTSQNLGVFLDEITQASQSAGIDFNTFIEHTAVVTAHEIGHSLGLPHNANGLNIMNSFINPLNLAPGFAAEDITLMSTTLLPGPGR